jgi:hypothetical protein
MIFIKVKDVQKNPDFTLINSNAGPGQGKLHLKTTHKFVTSLAAAALPTLLYVKDNPANLMLVEQIIEGNP